MQDRQVSGRPRAAELAPNSRSLGWPGPGEGKALGPRKWKPLEPSLDSDLVL
jgi:hypothetical protein